MTREEMEAEIQRLWAIIAGFVEAAEYDIPENTLMGVAHVLESLSESDIEKARQGK